MQELKQQLILADKQKSAEAEKLEKQEDQSEDKPKSAEAEDQDHEPIPEASGAANELDESGLKEEMEGMEDSVVNRRRQETVGFQIDENEVSFNAYRAIIEDRQSRCYLQTQIDQEVKDMQQKF